mmetsp:Transcript_29968/g.39829  ORF Transcript_29968/g.39829 Transcript_29968/m.39829 type:complete len:90 (+) Transcript_29968:154-423(+)
MTPLVQTCPSMCSFLAAVVLYQHLSAPMWSFPAKISTTQCLRQISLSLSLIRVLKKSSQRPWRDSQLKISLQSSNSSSKLSIKIAIMEI